MKAEDGEGAVVIDGVGRVGHGSLEEIFRLEAVANLVLEDVETGGEGNRNATEGRNGRRREGEEEEKGDGSVRTGTRSHPVSQFWTQIRYLIVSFSLHRRLEALLFTQTDRVGLVF